MSKQGIEIEEHRKYNVEVPADLRPLLETIAKEVIRNQPNNVYQFTSLLVQKLIDIRAANNSISPIDDPKLYAKFKDALGAEAEKQGLCLPMDKVTLNIGVSKPIVIPTVVKQDLDESASKIQDGVRGFLTRKHLEEQGVKVHHPDQRCRSTSPCPIMLNQAGGLQANPGGTVVRAQSNDALASPQKHQITDETEAASKIQAGIRGFLTRKHLEERGIKVHHPESNRSPSPAGKILRSQENLSTLDSNTERARRNSSETEAASKIQAGVRGFLTRKHLQDQGITVHTPHEVHVKKIDNAEHVQGAVV